VLGSRLNEAAWRVVVEPWLLKWVSVFLVGLLQPEPLLFIWDQCLLFDDWKTAIEAGAVAVLLAVRDQLLATRVASGHTHAHPPVRAGVEDRGALTDAMATIYLFALRGGRRPGLRTARADAQPDTSSGESLWRRVSGSK
jgi:hypothetical protein